MNISKYQSNMWGTLATKMENELKNPKEVKKNIENLNKQYEGAPTFTE